MTRAQLTKSFICTALLLTTITSCILSSEGSGFSLIPTSLRQWWSTLNLPSLSTTGSLDDETAAALQAIQEENRRREGYITRRDEVLPQVLPNVDRGARSLVNTIDERFFSRYLSLTELAEPADQLDYLVSRLTLRLERIGGGLQITPEQIQRIGQRFPNVRELIFTHTNLGNEGLKILSQQPYAQRLTTLDIPGNSITQEGIPALSRFTSLTSLSVAHNQLGNGGLKMLSELPFTAQLISLDISGTSIEPDGLIYLNKFSSLKKLLIARNKLGNRGLATLSQQQVAHQLTTLDIHDNGITAEGIHNSFGSFTKLKNLYMGSNSIGDAGIAALAQLPIAPQLTTLHIERTGITLQSLRESLKAFTALTDLSISNNGLGDDALRPLSELPFAHELTHLYLSFNDINRATWDMYKSTFGNLKRPMTGLVYPVVNKK